MGAGVLPWVFFTGQIAVTLSFLAVFSYLQNKLKKEKGSFTQGEPERKITKVIRNKELDRFIKENLELKNKLLNKEEESAKAVSRYLSAEGKLKNKDLGLEVLKKENVLLKDKISGKEEELKSTVSQKLALESEFKKQIEDIGALKKENTALAANSKNLDTHIDSQLERLNKENLELKNKLTSKDSELEGLVSQRSVLGEELKKQDDDFTALKKENTALAAKLKNLDTHIDSQLERLNKENSELKNKLTSKDSELESAVSQRSALEEEIRKQGDDFAALKKENLAASVKLKESDENVVKLKKEIETQSSAIVESKNKEKAPLKLLEEEVKKVNKQPEESSERKKKKIGEILLENNFITKETLDKALKYQEEYGTSVTQYLLGYGYINEHQLAQCICTQFNIPYLPLKSYNIRPDIIDLISVDIAEKYWLVPVEKTRDTLMVVMADPWDSKAIKEVEEISGFRVQPFVGILSEIVEALESYYKIVIKEKGKKIKNTAPFFIDSETYEGPERRKTVRFTAKIDVSFPLEGLYKKSVTKDISREGVFFESEKALPLASLLSFQIDLPKDCYPLPITALIQVVRVMDLENGKFGIGAKILKIAKQEIDAIISYASKYKEK